MAAQRKTTTATAPSHRRRHIVHDTSYDDTNLRHPNTIITATPAACHALFHALQTACHVITEAYMPRDIVRAYTATKCSPGTSFVPAHPPYHVRVAALYINIVAEEDI